MPGQVTHIAVAEKIYSEILHKFIAPAFMVGTVFPDIRYLKVISREQTHLAEITLKDVLTESTSFAAGLKFHSLTDKVHEQFMNERHAYQLCPPSRLVTQTLKAFESEIHYSRSNKWSRLIKTLDFIYPEELQFGIEKTDLRRWHKMLQDYFSQSPSEQTNKKFMLDLGFPAEDADKMNSDIEIIRNSEQLTSFAEQFYDQFEDLIIG